MIPMMTGFEAGVQSAGGTWSELFSRGAAVNAVPLLTVLAWYLTVLAIGTVFYPLTRLVFGGDSVRGWGVSRFFGLLVWGVTVWLASQFGATFLPITMTACFCAWALVNLILFFGFWKVICGELRLNRKRILTIEAVFLGLFVFFLLIRLGNPDLWHPYKGGEKPMDFSYFNAVLKSTILPPYDPWFSGGRLNYYYYGFFLSGLLTKWLGIVPSVAYNLILPTWFAYLGVGAFSIGATIFRGLYPDGSESAATGTGLLSVTFLQLIGNLGTLGIIGSQLVQLGRQALPMVEGQANGFIAFFVGIRQLFAGHRFQLYPGDWYWIPSRAIPGEPITEFPYFTFLYGDPHAHLFALPITVLVLVWIVSLAFRVDRCALPKWGEWVIALIGGGLTIGSLIPTNTWDFPTFLLLAIGAIGLIVGRFRLSGPDAAARKAGIIAASAVLVAVVSAGLFLPYLLTNWRDSGMMFWEGDRTPQWAYLLHWGIFLFAVAGWLIYETMDWLKVVKISAVRKFYARVQAGFFIFAVFLVIVFGFFAATKAPVGLIAFPLMLWALVLLLRPGQPLLKRIIFFCLGTAFFITLFVEFTALRGDVGRMNMVFKLYNQAWTLMALGAAIGAAVTMAGCVGNESGPLSRFSGTTATAWKILFSCLLFSGALFTLTASVDKIRDRMVKTAPHSLDGMAYMDSAFYSQDGFTMDLSQDANAIRWFQENVSGSPAIAEGHATEYKWGNRMAVYTGLPSVIGWNYHQRQQRTMMTEAVWKRVEDVNDFYTTTSVEAARAFLDTYGVRYVVVGQLERGLYDPAGIAKFDAADGDAWEAVFRDRDTVIYEVKK